MSARVEHTLLQLHAAGVIAVLRCDTAADAVAVARELVAAGVRAVEVTWTTPDATAVLRELAHEPGVAVGAGTICTARHAEVAAAAGASFLVCPGSPPGLIAAMRDTEAAVVAGALTPTEIMTALGAGADAIKLFPAIAVGPSYLTQVQGPFPELRVIPTGGVTANTAEPWLAAGAWALGCGGALAPRRLRDPADAAQLRERARELLQAVRATRP